jgi:23S rRNA pseudouridine2605 synthase
MSQQRLQRVIARAGIASRRAAEELIASGRVRVNGARVQTLGTKVGSDDKVEVDGHRIVAESSVYFVMNKPRGVVSTVRDPEGRPTVREIIGSVAERVFPVGRLDFHTSGVLLLTNDGDFCDALIHPKRQVPKTYVVKVTGDMGDGDRRRWEQGVPIEGGVTAPAEVRVLRHEAGKTWLEVTLFEGRNQQIRKMGEATGFPVMRLSRTSFGGITSDGLRPGGYRSLTLDELREMRDLFGVPKRMPHAAPAFEQGPVNKNFDRPRPAKKVERGPSRKTSEQAPKSFERAPAGKRFDRSRNGFERPATGKSVERGRSGNGFERAPAGRKFERAPAGKSFERAAAGKKFERAPAGKSFERAPAGKRFERAPAGKKFERGPTGKSFERAPAGKSFERAPTGKSFERAPTGKSFERQTTSARQGPARRGGLTGRPAASRRKVGG